MNKDVINIDPKAEAAFAVHAQIASNEEKRRALLADNAKWLCEMFETEMYKDILGDPEAPWAGYLGQIETFYSRFEVDSYIRVYRKLSKELGLPAAAWVQVPITRLADCVRFVDAINWEDWLSNALVLTSKDWTIKLRAAKGLTTEEEEHTHDMVQYNICKICGRKEKHTHDTKTTTTVDSEGQVLRQVRETSGRDL